MFSDWRFLVIAFVVCWIWDEIQYRERMRQLTRRSNDSDR